MLDYNSTIILKSLLLWEVGGGVGGVKGVLRGRVRSTTGKVVLEMYHGY
jgi:hypothetical protein